MDNTPFKRHRFSPEVILLAVRWYCRYPLSYRNVRDILNEKGVEVDPATINRWVFKFEPEVAKRSYSQSGFRDLEFRDLDWYVDETYLQVSFPDVKDTVHRRLINQPSSCSLV